MAAAQRCLACWNGQKLLELIKQVNLTKPVIILIGGLVESGRRAVASHTSALAGSVNLWDAFFKQSGEVRIGSPEEMADVVQAFLNLGEIGGRRITVLGTGDEIGVTMADECSVAGLDLPPLPPELMKKLREFIPAAGNMICNPIDALPIFLDLDTFGRTLDILSEGSFTDMFIISLAFDWQYNHQAQQGPHIEEVSTYIANQTRKYTNGKPLVVACRQYQNNPDIGKWIAIVDDILQQSGFPFFQAAARAVFVLS
jgi:acyl-CoA synthetase (NDP forming)